MSIEKFSASCYFENTRYFCKNRISKCSNKLKLLSAKTEACQLDFRKERQSQNGLHLQKQNKNEIRNFKNKIKTVSLEKYICAETIARCDITSNATFSVSCYLKNKGY